MTRIETAIQLRDHALSILRRHGSYQPVGDAKFLMWDTGPEVAAKTLVAKHGLPLDQAKRLTYTV
jgi:hypothetical protein